MKAESCPSCGRHFDAVKCPQCSFTGKPDAFVNGCPSCGYLRGERRERPPRKTLPEFPNEPDLTSPESAPDEPFVGPEVPHHPGGADGRRSARKQSRYMSRTAFAMLMIALVSILIVLLVLYFRL